MQNIIAMKMKTVHGMVKLKSESKSYEISMKSVQHFTLHAMLKLPAAYHCVYNFVNGALRIRLLHKVLDNILLRHLIPDRESPFQLFLDARQHLVIFVRCKSLRTC